MAMDLSTYKERRRKGEEERQAALSAMRSLCLRCRRARQVCVCAALAPFDPGVDFVILQHPWEAKRQNTGTARLAHLILNGSRFIIGQNFQEHEEVQALIADARFHSVVLYPGEKAANVSDGVLTAQALGDKILRVFVIDGTWAHARKMLRLSANLRVLPQICFTWNRLSRFEMKKQPRDFCLSTIEAIHALLTELEGQGLVSCGDRKEALLGALQAMVDIHRSHLAAGPKPRHGRSCGMTRQRRWREV